MSVIFPRDLLRLVIVPVLQRLDLYSPASANLLLATVLAESVAGGWQRLAQVNGSALGLYQIEPATHRDQWENWLKYKHHHSAKVMQLVPNRAPQAGKGIWYPADEELVWNLAYATAIARIKYYRDREPLPPAGDLAALGAYWKRVYNTPKGKGSVEGFLAKVEPYHPFFLTEDS